MKLSVCLFVLELILTRVSSKSHSLRYFYTASRGIKDFPEFVAVGMVDNVELTHYDSNIRRDVPKQDWMKTETEGDPQYWDRNTQVFQREQQNYKNNIEVAMKHLNQTGEVHIFQRTVGCGWNDETGEVTGFDKFGFDGEDFIEFDLETETWIAPRPELFNTKLKWDKNVDMNNNLKKYLIQECPEWLKKYIGFGKSTFLRKELPSISLLQKSSSSPVTCHATGFYPDGAMLFWTKDGEELYEGVDIWEVLPNHDGTFQKSAVLNVSSVPPEDWDRYSCVFQLSGVRKYIFTKLDKAAIRTNEKKSSPLIIAAVVVGVCAALAVALGFVLYKKKTTTRLPTPVSEPGVEVELNPKS